MPHLGARMTGWVLAFPGAVLQVASNGMVLDSNGRLERALERELVGHSLQSVLDPVSRLKFEQLASRESPPGEDPALWELSLEGRYAVAMHAFYPVRDPDAPGDTVWLVESPRDARLEVLHEEFAAVNSEQASTQRQLSKEKARLGRALDELERELRENEKLSRTLQAQNQEMETQNEELLAMTQELHVGQEQLLQLNHQLERRSRELQLAMSARNRFYASMSHELRTPINAIMGYNDLLLASVYGALSEQQELAVERCQKAAQHLRELVNDVLDISKLEAGKIDLELEPIRIGDVVEDLFVTLRPLADARGSQLKLSIRDVPRTVVSDPRRVRQILLNLLSNAIKFGNGGPIWVHCTRSADGGVSVEVVDSGEGIAADDLPRIFDEFVQLAREENSHSASDVGTGLGLPISRRLAQAIGASLDVSSTPGLGSTFRLTLPPVAGQR